jgi:hypothetical protein
MRVIALIEKPDIIEPILRYLDRWRISYRPVYRANVRSGSLADPQPNIGGMSAFGGEADVKSRGKPRKEGQLTAISGRLTRFYGRRPSRNRAVMKLMRMPVTNRHSMMGKIVM